MRIGIRFSTNTNLECTPSISDDWDEADPERALSNRMTRSAQLPYTGLLHFYGGRAETARMLGFSVPTSRLAIANEVIEKSSGSGCEFSLTSTETLSRGGKR